MNIKLIISFIVLCTIMGSCTKEYVDAESSNDKNSRVTPEFLVFDTGGRTYQDGLLIDPTINNYPDQNSVYVSWNTLPLSSCAQIEIALFDEDNNQLSTVSPYSSEGNKYVVLSGQPTCRKYYIRLNTCSGLNKYDTAHFYLKPDNRNITMASGRNITYPNLHRRGDIVAVKWNLSSVVTQCGTSLSNLTLRAAQGGTDLINLGSVTANQTFYYKVPVTWTDGIYDFILKSTDTCCKFEISTAITVSGDPSAVLYPNGGEHISNNLTPNVISAAWDPAYFSGTNVKIEALKNGTVYYTLASSTANDGLQTYMSFYQSAPSTDCWKVRITSTTNSNYVAESVACFAALYYTNPPGLYNPYPNRTWHIAGADSNPIISWNTASFSGNVKIELYKDATLYSTVATNQANTGSININATTLPVNGTCWKIKITSVSNPSVFYWSEYCFYVQN
jgi:hypothetical protein